MTLDYRLQKQLIIIFVYLLIFSLIGFSVYYIWFRQKPSCFDNIKNQDEEEIDCGGLCISCEVKALRNIEIIWTKAFSVKPFDNAQSEGVYDLAAKIENSSSNYGAEKISFEFKLYDRDDNLIMSKNGMFFILPNETKYIIEQAVKTQKSVSKINLVLGAPDWKKLKDFKKTEVFIKNKQNFPLETGGFYRVSGEVKNDSPFDFEIVTVDVVLFDNQNQPIGAGKTTINTLVTGEARYFTATWYSPIESEVVSTEAIPETNAFKNENFMKRYGVPEKFKGI